MSLSLSEALKGLNWELFQMVAQSSHAGPQHTSHSGFHPGAFPGMFKSALCMFVPSGHFRISQNIQSPQMETLFPCLSPFLSSPGWGLGHCRALFRGCRKHFKAQQSWGCGWGLVKPPAGQEGGLNSTSHPLGLGTSLDSKQSTKEKKKVHWFP